MHISPKIYAALKSLQTGLKYTIKKYKPGKYVDMLKIPQIMKF